MSPGRQRSSKQEELNAKVPEYKKRRAEAEQQIGDLNFMNSEEAVSLPFENRLNMLYGTQGVGKTRFAYELGLALQRKYNLAHSGAYFLRCEQVNHRLQTRYEDIRTWPTLSEFVRTVPDSIVESVKLWIVDPIDALIPKGLSTLSAQKGYIDPADWFKKIGESYFSVAYQELRTELLYQIGELQALGPGVLLISHERTVKVKAGRMEVEKARADLSNSIYNAIDNVCSMVLRMRHCDAPLDQDEKQDRPMRCLAVVPSEYEEVKDNLEVVLPQYPNGEIPFRTEAEAVDKLFGCFQDADHGAVKKTVKRKKVKKSKKKKASRRR